MKSEIQCPACGALLETTRSDYNARRLWCGSTHCMDQICREGVYYEPALGEDVNAAAERLRERFERSKEAKTK